jgi:hypothetical protein
MDTECFHAYVIHTIIGMRSNDLSVASYSLNQANDRFRRVGHVVSLAGALLHYAAYLLTHENLRSGREALAEALTILRNHQLYGTPYWDPLLMVELCRKVIQEDIWDDQADSLAAHLFHIPESSVAKKFELEGGPKGMWAEYATALAVRRLARNYWREFVPLLSDPRPLVRRRAIQVLYASDSTEAKALVEPLRADPAGEAEHYFFTQKVWPVQIHSFGPTKLFINGRPLKLDKASTSKALLIFNALLLYRQYGMSSNDLGLLLWPEKSPTARSSVLQMTISNLRAALGEALDKPERKQVIKSEQGRYYLRLPETAVWWDWQELQRISSGMPIDAHIRRAAEGLYRESFMRIFAELLPPPNLDPTTELAWERIVRSLSAMATDYEIEAEKWMAAIRGRSSAWSEE